MALVLKTDPAALAYGRMPVGSFSVPGHRGVSVEREEDVFWVTSETRGGHGLIARGWIVEAETDTEQSGKTALRIAFDKFGPTDPLTKDDFASLENRPWLGIAAAQRRSLHAQPQ